MSLKLKYATSLLLVVLLIIAITAAIVISYNNNQYLLMLFLFGLLYLSTFLIGRRLRKVFLVLSLIKFIKDRNGSVSLSLCCDFIDNITKPGTAPEEKDRTRQEVISLLLREEIVEKTGTNLTLTGN